MGRPDLGFGLPFYVGSLELFSLRASAAVRAEMRTLSAARLVTTAHSKSRLLALPCDLLVRIALLCASSACAIRASHPSLAKSLAHLCKEWEMAYRWLACATTGCAISTTSLRLRCEHPHAWSTATPLPSWGQHGWSIHVEENIEGEQGAMLIGVSDPAGTAGWGLNPHCGEVRGNANQDLS